jgi:16S rRNA (cytosine1402-N4)-methyltransferase
MVNEVINMLAPKDGGIYVDATFGGGGYTRAILEQCDCVVIAIDRDEQAIKRAREWAGAQDMRVIPVHGNFADLAKLVAEAGYAQVDGIVMDLGLSSNQLADSERGFSLKHDGPLDMRMDASEGESAADLIMRADENELMRILREYGEERHARVIAKAIIEARQREDIATTAQLAEIVRNRMPGKHKLKIDPATRTFQALRIAVNDELGALDDALLASEDLLRPGGRLVVVSFHSLEDRRVKQFINSCAKPDAGQDRHMPMLDEPPSPSMTRLHRKVVTPSEEEVCANPRARSAKLRAAEREDAPAIHAKGGGR